jgi:hypothetical protein
MSDQHSPMPHEQLLGVLFGFWTAAAVGSFARLKIADAMAKGAADAGAIAEAINANPEAVNRLLRGCTMAKIVTSTGPKTYALTPVGELLRSDSMPSLRALLDAETAPGHWLPWGHLDQVVKSGKNDVEKALGMNVWDYYAKNKDEGNTFSQAMTGMSMMAVHAVAAAYTYPTATKVVDVGGAHGALLGTVLAAQPNAKGVLFDLPHVVETAPAQDRVEKIGGDFFKEVPAGGELYLLKFILHDWDDANCVAILKQVRRAMAPGGKLAVIEMLIPEDGAPHPSKLLDLNMMVMLTGRERTGAEMTALLEKADFKVAKIVPTHSPFSIIEAT